VRISSKVGVLGIDLDNTLTFRVHNLRPWWCFVLLLPLLMVLPPNKPMINVLREFRKSGGKIVIVSSRPRFFIKLSKLWLDHYKVPYHKIRCVGFIYRNQRKLQAIREESIKCFIDDDPTMITFVKKNESSVKALHLA